MREIHNQFLRRLIMAWRFKVWPWSLHRNTVKWVALDQRLTRREVEHGQECARRLGWFDDEEDNEPTHEHERCTR